MSGNGSNIKTGDISGTGIAVGDHAQATVNISQQAQKEVLDLIAHLRDQIQKADIAQGAKNVLLNKAVPEMEAAVRKGEAKSGVERGLERINDQLEGAGAVAKSVGGIVETVSKIAQTVGIALKFVAPALFKLL